MIAASNQIMFIKLLNVDLILNIIYQITLMRLRILWKKYCVFR